MSNPQRYRLVVKDHTQSPSEIRVFETTKPEQYQTAPDIRVLDIEPIIELTPYEQLLSDVDDFEAEQVKAAAGDDPDPTELIARLRNAVEIQTGRLVDISLTIADVHMDMRTEADAFPHIERLSAESYNLTEPKKA